MAVEANRPGASRPPVMTISASNGCSARCRGRRIRRFPSHRRGYLSDRRHRGRLSPILLSRRFRNPSRRSPTRCPCHPDDPPSRCHPDQTRNPYRRFPRCQSRTLACHRIHEDGDLDGSHPDRRARPGARAKGPQSGHRPPSCHPRSRQDRSHPMQIRVPSDGASDRDPSDRPPCARLHSTSAGPTPRHRSTRGKTPGEPRRPRRRGDRARS